MNPMEGASTVERMLMQEAKEHKNPINGSIELLPLCNMNCDMCYVRMSRAEMEKKGRLRTPEEWLALGREMQRAGTLFLLLTGGEPLLYPGFKEVYVGLKKLGMVLTVNTNGTLLDEEWADFFKANKPRRINITLYGADARAYGELCHYPEGFDRTVNAVKLLRARGVDVRIGASVTPQNADDLEKIADIGKELDCPVNIDTYMMPSVREKDGAFDEGSRLTPEEAAACRVQACRCSFDREELKKYAAERVREAEEGLNAAPKTGNACMAGNCSYTVNWQGEMRPCVILHTPSVNVFEKGFMKAWEEISGFCASIVLNEKCQECRLRPLCRTCYACALLETGDPQGIPAYMCRYTEESFRLFKEIRDRQ